MVASEELREPKAFANTAAAVNVVSNSVVEEPSFEAPIIIDLTSGLEEEEVLVTGDQPQIITFSSPRYPIFTNFRRHWTNWKAVLCQSSS